jgi:hypothetical protein
MDRCDPLLLLWQASSVRTTPCCTWVAFFITILRRDVLGCGQSSVESTQITSIRQHKAKPERHDEEDWHSALAKSFVPRRRKAERTDDR